MDLHKVYHDSTGVPRTVLQMVKYEPEWAANRIQEGEKAIEQIAALKNSEPIAQSLTQVKTPAAPTQEEIKPDCNKCLRGSNINLCNSCVGFNKFKPV